MHTRKLNIDFMALYSCRARCTAHSANSLGDELSLQFIPSILSITNCTILTLYNYHARANIYRIERKKGHFCTWYFRLHASSLLIQSLWTIKLLYSLCCAHQKTDENHGYSETIKLKLLHLTHISHWISAYRPCLFAIKHYLNAARYLFSILQRSWMLYAQDY